MMTGMKKKRFCWMVWTSHRSQTDVIVFSLWALKKYQLSFMVRMEKYIFSRSGSFSPLWFQYLQLHNPLCLLFSSVSLIDHCSHWDTDNRCDHHLNASPTVCVCGLRTHSNECWHKNLFSSIFYSCSNTFQSSSCIDFKHNLNSF